MCARHVAVLPCITSAKAALVLQMARSTSNHQGKSCGDHSASPVWEATPLGHHIPVRRSKLDHKSPLACGGRAGVQSFVGFIFCCGQINTALHMAQVTSRQQQQQRNQQTTGQTHSQCASGICTFTVMIFARPTGCCPVA